MIIVLVTIVVLLATIYVYFKRTYFTSDNSVPGLSPQILVGNLAQSGITRGKSLAAVFLEWQKIYGDVFQFWFGPMPLICVCGIEDVQHIFTHRQIYEQGDSQLCKQRLLFHDALVCNIGAKHKRHAALTVPLFRRAKIISNLDLIVNCTDKLLEQWHSKSEDRMFVHLDLVTKCRNLLLDIFGFIAFNYDLECLDSNKITKPNELTQALSEFLDIFVVAMRKPMFMIKLYLASSSRYRTVISTIHEYFNQMIEQEQRKSSDEIIERKRKSLIASLVESLQQDEKSEAAKPEEDKRGLSKNEVFDEMLLFLMAGYETSSAVLAWFIHLISKHPQVQMKIKAELAQYTQHQLSIDQLDSLVYLDCVIEEVLRFAPPTSGVTRTLTSDDQLPQSRIKLRKGDQIMITFHNLARDKRYWNIDPELFYPERFQEEDKNHNPYASIPFGGGHRQCIGQDLAKFEIKVIAARLLQHVTFGDGGPEVNQGGHEQKLTIVPRHLGVTITFD
ncbi:unnamed protein product [Rotaria sp. Silwood2]|nr:unnamed protein product [Rotaria sp. Silwood2]CAF3018999.1 unnamed protein product [Rotaria sp. Silwood2]CAF3062342.1 unnamed protein product [Rotaria sp. Silwood2]CAF3366574.1 unnamed protein product [Rotaria sp. Silwood2]CAF4156479.1 unnamed protein product [Rotaria sp. Silwood2]